MTVWVSEPLCEIRKSWGSGKWDECRYWYVDGEYLTYRTKNAYGSTRKDENVRFRTERKIQVFENPGRLNTPWQLEPRGGKYYGTRILDSEGDEVMEFWDHSIAYPPSERERVYSGCETEEEWRDWCCDSHWENERDYQIAEAVVRAMNEKYQRGAI